MRQELKQYVRESVAAGPGPKKGEPDIAILEADHLVVNVMGPHESASFTLRPAEVSRMKGRFGRGPNFEKWVADRVRDMIITYGGG